MIDNRTEERSKLELLQATVKVSLLTLTYQEENLNELQSDGYIDVMAIVVDAVHEATGLKMDLIYDFVEKTTDILDDGQSITLKSAHTVKMSLADFCKLLSQHEEKASL